MRISNIKIYKDIEDIEVLKIACKKSKIDINKISNWYIVKKSIDARDKKDVHYNYSLEIEIYDNQKISSNISTKFNDFENSNNINKLLVKEKRNFLRRPVVVGMGPAGLFCAYVLALNGAKPIVIEQGEDVDSRKITVDNFLKNGILNTKSNVQFGEGGAGTFSDGKLTTNINSEYNRIVLETFVKFGAPGQILYLNKPHIGTDNLVKVVKNIRNEIIRLGGEVYFNSKLTGFKYDKDKVQSLILENTNQIDTDDCVLAIGHSSRDIFKTLFEDKVAMEPKPFSIGVRIEHKQVLINKAQYGEYTKLKLPPAEYKMVFHDEKYKRGVYTFCMCPGGVVMASSSEENTIVTNGMSKFLRDGENANSAILVNVNPEDYIKEDFGKYKSTAISGIFYQKKYEELAFKLGGGNYKAPIQRVEDFFNNKKSSCFGDVKPTYMPGVSFANLNEILPEYIKEPLKNGIKYFDTKIKGFARNDCLLTGLETRSSSPVRIIRNNDYTSNKKGIYPCGEGAGYAGGIMTAAIDGIKVAKSLLEKKYC